MGINQPPRTPIVGPKLGLARDVQLESGAKGADRAHSQRSGFRPALRLVAGGDDKKQHVQANVSALGNTRARASAGGLQADGQRMGDGVRSGFGQSLAQRLMDRDPSNLRISESEAAVAHENRSAAMMSALDPRWALAVRTMTLLDSDPTNLQSTLKTGKVLRTLLTPVSRRELQAMGKRLGLRPFDVNLVIAIVQDAARQGRDPLGPDARAALHLVNPGAKALKDKVSGRGNPDYARALSSGQGFQDRQFKDVARGIQTVPPSAEPLKWKILRYTIAIGCLATLMAYGYFSVLEVAS